MAGERHRPHGPWAIRKELPLINIISVAFLAHYNAPKFSDELAAPGELRGAWLVPTQAAQARVRVLYVCEGSKGK